MKTNLLTTVFLVGMLSSCSSSFFLTSNTTGEDDIYYNPDKKYVASVNGSDINPINAKDPKIADLQRRMNATSADTVVTSDTIYVEEKSDNPYDAILVNSFDESRERRLNAQSELGFNYSAYNDALFYASAYDPAFYNVVVYGSHVWVEPRWITSSWYFPRSTFSMGFGFGYGAGYGSYWPGYSFGYGVYSPWSIGYYPGYADYLYDYGGYNFGRPANSGEYHYGPRQGSNSVFSNSGIGVKERGVVDYGGTRTRGTDTRSTVSGSANTTNTGNYQGRDGGRRPGNNNTSNSNGTVERRRPSTNTVYTRPSSVNQGRGGYTPTYNRPSGGVRQDYNTNRPASSGNSNTYERRAATNYSSGSSNQNSGSSSSNYSRPATTNSGSSSTNNSNNGSSGGTRRR